MNIDIVKLIENNPITKLNGNYQNKLIDKIKNNFTNYEQQLFLSSFYCYLKYDKYDFIIDLDNIWEWLGFSQKVKAKQMLEKNFIVDQNYKKLLYHEVKQKNIQGGHNKETFMINTYTFKKFCLKSNTKKADEIHDYFIKLEEILHDTLYEESSELKLQLEQIELNKHIELEEKLLKQKELEKEQFLLKEYSSIGSIFYIIKVKTFENKTYIIKIGESRKGIIDRYREHKNNFTECLLLDCFKVDKSKDFESFIKYNEVIRPNQVKDLLHHENETELFLIGQNLTYQTLLKIINDNISIYNYRISELLSENELLKYKLDTQQNSINIELIENLVKNNNLLLNKVNSLENSIQEILNKFNNTNKQVKTTTGFNQQLPSLGPRLQKINSETFILLKVYETVTEAMNENKHIKRTSIMKAINENTIYCGYRWLLVERNLDPNIIYNLQPTKKTKVQNIGYIAKLNKDKTHILNVYLDRKTASELNNYHSHSALDNPVKNQTISKGHYYILYQNCNIDLINNFENKNGKPILYKNGIGQYDMENNLLLEFICKSECIKELKISDRTLSKAIKKNIPYNNHYYRELGEKISIL